MPIHLILILPLEKHGGKNSSKGLKIAEMLKPVGLFRMEG